MQYVRSISSGVSKTWNSINPATLSGAIDVIVVEGDDGTLACSPFHVRFGKFSLLRPYEKKVEFFVHGEKQDYSMNLGEGGEAFFVFETSDDIPEALQTSPLMSPASSPPPLTTESSPASSLQEPDFLDLAVEHENGKPIPRRPSRPGAGTGMSGIYSNSLPKGSNFLGALTPLSTSPTERPLAHAKSQDFAPSLLRADTDDLLSATEINADLAQRQRDVRSFSPTLRPQASMGDSYTERSQSPPPLPIKEAIERAHHLSKQLVEASIPSTVTDTGDLMLDMTGYKSSEDDALRAEVVARKILSEELEGNYDIGALIGADERGNLWIYSSEEAKLAAAQRAALAQPKMPGSHLLTDDAASDPGYHSDNSLSCSPVIPTAIGGHARAVSELGGTALQTPPDSPGTLSGGDPNRNYAKTLRLTSDQLKSLNLRPGPNHMSFTVNRVTCQAYMYLWRHDVPVIISDIDGTITKSDALGHLMNLVGRDWTHVGVAKLYTEIVSNGYNILYLTSRSVGLADITRSYLAGVVQDGYRLPRGPTIMSPDRTIAALRREVYLRKPEVFKMACLRDIKNLFLPYKIVTPFYAGFGNRLTDALSYRSVSIPSNRIFTINSYAEVSLDLLSLNKLKLSYVNMREVVDHYFPPTSMLVKGGGEEFTDFTYWRDTPLEMDDFSASESSSSVADDEEQQEDEEVGEMGDSYISREDDDGHDRAASEVDEDEDEGEEDYEHERGYITTGNTPFVTSMAPQDERDDYFDDDPQSPSNSVQSPFTPTQKLLNSAEPRGHALDRGMEAAMPKLDEAARTPGEPRREDLDAEVITGMKTMKLEKEDTVPEAEAGAAAENGEAVRAVATKI